MARKRKKTHLGYGIAGSFIGCIPGMLLWFILIRFNINGVIGAFFIGLGAFYGFKLLGKRFNTKGIVITAIIVLFMVFITNRLCSTMELYYAYNGYYTLGKCFVSLMDALKIGGTLMNYYLNLFVGVLLSLFGQTLIVVKDFNDNK